jgi:hypothetical protein
MRRSGCAAPACRFPRRHAARPAPGAAVRRRAPAGAAALRPLGRGARRAVRGGSGGGGRRRIDRLVPGPDLGRAHLRARYREHEGAQAADFRAVADFTEETAAQNPDWALDLSDEEIGHWRGPEGRRGIITLVWGVSLVANGAAVTTELGPTTTDQCTLVDERFTLVSLDAYTGDYVEVRLYGARGAELARESLYEDD